MGEKSEIQERKQIEASRWSLSKYNAFYGQVFKIWQHFFLICINLQLFSRKRAVVKAEQFINLLSVHTELLNVVHSWLQVNGNKLTLTKLQIVSIMLREDGGE